MGNRGKLEGALHIGSGGWSADVTDGTSTETVTVPGDGYRFLSTSGDLTDGLLTELQQQLNATMTDAFLVTMSSSGIVTITNDSGNSTDITWTDTELRDALGFTGDVSGQIAHTGPSQAAGIWLPDCPVTKRNSGNWAGDVETDYMGSESPDGSVYALMGAKKTVLSLRWDAISQAKTWTINESTTNAAFQTFLSDVIWGESAFGQPSGPVRYYPDETDDGTYNTYRVPSGVRDFRPPQHVQNYSARWGIELPRLVKLPS